ncbi:solute carrier family 2, facilitated glucose transporter member 5-like [Candoia aspera]|uniref:solute carrier family 2, facilitated glucose transporter member 5-like n=1 Tax=Candoia aspera TaxID=51853 RepID=UPI002FD7A15F
MDESKKSVHLTTEEVREQEAMEEPSKTELSKTLIWVSLASASISLHYGYNIWLVYSPGALLREFYNASSFHVLVVPKFHVIVMAINIAIFPLGGIFGSLLVGFLADTLGRKGCLVLTNILAMVSAIFMSCTYFIYGLEFTFFARLFTGICAGLIFSTVPLYLGEIAPRNHRGGLILLTHFYLTVGVLLAQILSANELLGNAEGWPVLMGLAGFAPLVQAFLLPFIPESPRYLMIYKKNEQQARKVLKFLRETEDVEDEIEEMHLEDLAESNNKDMSPLRLIQTPSLRWQVITIVVLMSGSQLSGISVAYFYTERIFLTMNLSSSSMEYVSSAAIIIISSSVLVAIYLVDSLGRRVFLLVGFAVCNITSVLLTMSLELQGIVSEMSYFSSILIIIFISAYNMGPGPLPNVLTTELFSQSSRSSAFVISGFVFWATQFITGLTFSYTEEYVKNYSFLIFWPICAGTFFYIFKMIPETKTQTYIDIKRVMSVQVTKKIHTKGKKRVKRHA